MRISDWSSDVCSSNLKDGFDLIGGELGAFRQDQRGDASDDRRGEAGAAGPVIALVGADIAVAGGVGHVGDAEHRVSAPGAQAEDIDPRRSEVDARSEEHTSELQSLMRISYAVFCLKKK